MDGVRAAATPVRARLEAVTPALFARGAMPSDQFLARVLHGLSLPQKELPCQFFYDERGSRLFEEICELEEYYLTRTELALMRRHGAEMAGCLGPDVLLIEYGSGASV